MHHIVSVLLESGPGMLSHVVGSSSTCGYNIETPTVVPTEDASLLRMTIVTAGSDDIIRQIAKYLDHLVKVAEVVGLTKGAHAECELTLMKVCVVGKEYEEMERTADIFRGRIIDITEKTYMIELTGNSSKFDAFPDAIDRTAILGTARTDSSGTSRGKRALKV